MATGFYDYSMKGIVECALKDKTTGVYFVLPAPAGGNFDPGIELGAIEESDCEGVTTNAKRFASKRDAKATLNFGAKLPEMIGLRLGKALKKQTTSLADVETGHFLVPASGIVTSAIAGYMGFGITANAASVASFQNEDGVTEALTQDSDFSAFDVEAVGNAKKFAVGANGALKFGTAAQERRVTIEIPFSTSAFYSLGDDLINLSLRVVGVNLLLQKIMWTFPDVSIEPGAVDLKEPTQEIGFFVNGNYDVRFFQLRHTCRDKAA